ncbi:MAG TPA: 1,4-dihydroxy-2-naphthoate octaprenyltransferase [Verrucomicrobiales bacterium]|nr:1,4-dihydroxy-2-naphthoate octaprenyltransferase [Verrucomicrobiales bacterium]
MLKSYLIAARPKTLPAAFVPVWVGCILAWHVTGELHWDLALWTFLGAAAIQIATNFFNDAIDCERGADTECRLGPRRVTASGLLSRRSVYCGAYACLLTACLCSLPLLQSRGWIIAVIGIPSLYLSYGYTGGIFPLAYLGLGEVFVILFFGIVAVGGSYFVQVGTWDWPAGVLGLQVGMLSAVLIAINNLRDVEEDKRSNKNTLAVRFGAVAIHRMLTGLVVVAMMLSFLGSYYGLSWFVALSVPWFLVGLLCVRGVKASPPSRRYNRFLAIAAVQLMLFAILFTAAVLL